MGRGHMRPTQRVWVLSQLHGYQWRVWKEGHGVVMHIGGRDGRDSGWGLDSVGQPAWGEFLGSRLRVASDSEAAQVHLCHQGPPGRWACCHDQDDVLFPSWFLPGRCLQSSTIIGIPIGAAFPEPKGRQAEGVSYEDPRVDSRSETLSYRTWSPRYQPS